MRRLRALLHTQPIHALELNKSSRGKDQFAPYDLIALQLEAIDHITDNMDPHRGVPEEEVRLHLARFAERMAPRRPQAEHREVAAVVLGGLENQGEGRFLIAYSDPANPAERVRADIELVRALQGDDGTLELRATPQAINLLLDALDHDIESAEDAMAYMFRFQFERGRLGKAAAHAQNMRHLSIAYREQIQDYLAAAARDISRVDWSGDVMATIDRAYAHLEARLREDAATQERVADQHEATPEPERRRKLAEIMELLEECNGRHRDLHAELMDARQHLRDYHAEQRLAPPPTLALVDLHTEVLQPVLGLRATAAARICERIAGGVVPPVPPGLASFIGIADHLWRARLEREAGGRPLEVPELEEAEPEPPRFSASALAAAAELLARPYEDERLSAVLAEAAAAGADVLVALGALEAFMDFNGDAPAAWWLVPPTLRADLCGERLAAGRLYGDELRLHTEGGPP